MKSDLPYGPVFVVDGPHEGHIGYYDDSDTIFEGDEYDVDLFPSSLAWREIDIEDEESPTSTLDVAIVYFGEFFLSEGYHLIPFEYIRPVTTDDLLKRREELHRTQGLFAIGPTDSLSTYEKLDAFRELHYVESELVNRMIAARYSNPGSGAKVFISHSSEDKHFARWIGTDLRAAGHSPWLDEWSINVGESIPKMISKGIDECDFVILILSRHAVSSNWVEKEWHAKYWSEVSEGTVYVLPVLYDDCDIPSLLRTKRYADFRNNYNNGLEDLLQAITRLSAKEA